MSKLSFLDDNVLYVKGFNERNNDFINNYIDSIIDTFDYKSVNNDSTFLYKVSKNNPLSNLYNDNFYVVRFAFKNIDNLHNDEQELEMNKLLKDLNCYMNNHKGYYNLRIPSHIIDLLRAFNKNIKNTIFCGGTVEEYIYDKEISIEKNSNINLFIADKKYLNKHEKELMDMTYKSFELYQGQYHISHITSSKAGKIYENWVKSGFNINDSENIIIAEIDKIPVGYVTIKETEYCIEGILSSVSMEYRKCGAYKNMIAYIIEYAKSKNKYFVSSTQFDNYIVQGTWNSLGLKPFYSIYNFHINNS